MLSKLLVAWCLMALCVAIHSAGLIMTLRFLKRQVLSIEKHAWIAVWTLVRIAGLTIFLHLLQIAVWAIYYSRAGAIPDLTSAFYFSAVTYTTTGYGDLVLPEEWRLIGGVEALTGILMCGLSTGMFFVLFSRTLGIDRSDKPST